jgi:uncharacterized Fe-S cluster-containing protein
MFVLKSSNLLLDSSKNRSWTCPFMKFSRIMVNRRTSLMCKISGASKPVCYNLPTMLQHAPVKFVGVSRFTAK